jgi:hypothetical protein
MVTLDSNRTTVTDANGSFAFDNVPAGSCVVRAELAGLKVAKKPKPRKVMHDHDLQVAIAMKLARGIESVTIGCPPAREDGAVFTMGKSEADKLPIGH